MAPRRRNDSIHHALLAAGFTVGGEGLAIDLVDTLKIAVHPHRDLLEPPGRYDAFWRAHSDQLPTDTDALAPPRSTTIELRAAAREILGAALENRAAEPSAVRLVNDTALRAAPIPQLTATGVTWRPVGDGDLVLGAVALSVIDTVTVHRDQLRRCARPQCSMIFLTVGARRIWCSDGCGNRVRVARHAAKA